MKWLRLAKGAMRSTFASDPPIEMSFAFGLIHHHKINDEMEWRDCDSILVILEMRWYSDAVWLAIRLVPTSCRFRKLDSRVSMMEPTKDRVCNNISEPLDRACAGRVLPERNMSSYVIIIGDVFR